jgi:8-oxo-dGTP diphosphatase
MQIEQVFSTYNWRGNRGLDKFKYCPICGSQLALTQTDFKPRPYCPNCGFIHYRNPFPSVSILIVQENKVILGKRSGEPGKGKWALPSGYVEFENDFLTAAVREVKEETGLEIEILSILNVQSAFLPPEYHFLSIFMLARVTGGKLSAGDDLEDVDWFPLSGPLPEMAFQPDADLIQAYLNGEAVGITVNPASKGLK